MSNDPLEEILKNTPFRMRSNHPGCMAPDGAEPCEHYRAALDEIERLRDALEAAAKSMDSAIRILNDTGLDYEERVEDARPYLHSRASEAHRHVGGQLPERCDRCGCGHNVGNPCPPTGQCPECGGMGHAAAQCDNMG